MIAKFITQYGNHLGSPNYFYVVSDESGVTAELLTTRQVRHQILRKQVTFLHQSLMTDRERDYLYRGWYA